MLDTIARLVNADAKLIRRGRFVDTTFLIAVDDDYTLIRVQEGRITKVTRGPFITPNYSFALRAPRDVWQKFWQLLPPLGFTDVFALVKQKLMRVEGDLHPGDEVVSNVLDPNARVRPAPRWSRSCASRSQARAGAG